MLELLEGRSCGPSLRLGWASLAGRPIRWAAEGGEGSKGVAVVACCWRGGSLVDWCCSLWLLKRKAKTDLVILGIS